MKNFARNDHADHKNGQNKENTEEPDKKGAQGISPKRVLGSPCKRNPAVYRTVAVKRPAILYGNHKLLDHVRQADVLCVGIHPGFFQVSVEYPVLGRTAEKSRRDGYLRHAIRRNPVDLDCKKFGLEILIVDAGTRSLLKIHAFDADEAAA